MLAEQFRMLEGGGNRSNETSVLAGSGQKGKEGDLRGQRREWAAELGQWGRRGPWQTALRWFCCLIGSQRRLWRMGWCVLGSGWVHCTVGSASELPRGGRGKTGQTGSAARFHLGKGGRRLDMSSVWRKEGLLWGWGWGGRGGRGGVNGEAEGPMRSPFSCRWLVPIKVCVVDGQLWAPRCRVHPQFPSLQTVSIQ